MIPLDLLTPSMMRMGWRLFQNTAEEEVPAHGCMRTVNTFKQDGEIAYRCAKPTNAFKQLYRINGPFTVPVDGWGICSTIAESGVVKGSASAQEGEEWGPQQNSWVLERNRPGFLIEGAFGDEGLMVAKQDIVRYLIGKAAEVIDTDDDGPVRLWMGPVGAEVQTEYTLTECYNRGDEIDLGGWCSVTFIHGQKYVARMTCPT